MAAEEKSELDLARVDQFVSENIVKFHQDKLRIIRESSLKTILKQKNPYLFRAKNLTVAADLVKELLEATHSASEEKLFGNFLEDLAVFVAGMTCGGRKSSATGIDLEFERNDTHYVVSVKSGSSWGNSSQHRKQEQDFQKAVTVLRQSGSV